MSETLIQDPTGLGGSGFNRLLTSIPGVQSLLPATNTANLTEEQIQVLNAKTLANKAVYGGNAELLRSNVQQYQVSSKTIDLFQSTYLPLEIQRRESHLRSLQNENSFFGIDFSGFGRILSGIFTLGLSEIPLGQYRLGEVARTDPFFSGLSSGGLVVTGTTSENEKQQFSLAFKAGTALASVSALSAGTDYSLSGGLSNLTGHTAPATFAPVGGITPTSGGFFEKTGFGVLFAQTFTTIGLFAGRIGQGLLQIATGNLLGGLQTIFTPPPSIVPPSGVGSGGYGGGGSGSGVGTGSPTTHEQTIGFVVLSGLVLLMIWLLRRK